MPEHIGTTDPDGVDFGWVMQMTFVLTIVIGSPLVAIVGLWVGGLTSWMDRLVFAIRVGAVVWIITAVGLYVVARQRH